MSKVVLLVCDALRNDITAEEMIILPECWISHRQSVLFTMFVDRTIYRNS